jgi:ATP-dependent Zn protease
MTDWLDWSDLPRPVARDLLAQLLDINDKRRLLLKVTGKVSPLPFYKEWRLVNLVVDQPKGEEDLVLEDTWALWHKGEPPILLDGSSGPVHEVNEKEHLQLDEPLIADYIRWFCFCVQADGQAFLIWEKPPKTVTPKDKKTLELIQPLTFQGRGADDSWQYQGTVIYSDVVFKAVFAVQKDGQMEMLDDEPLLNNIPKRLQPASPLLGYGRHVNAYLAQLIGSQPQVMPGAKPAASPRRKRAQTKRPTIVELVELLLESALRAQQENRLLTYFNATLPTATFVQQFAALFDSASPVIVVETNIPFVEETISEIVNDLRFGKPALIISQAQITTDSNGSDVVGQFSLPGQGPGIVLLPLQVYPRVMQVERLAFDIAALDLGAIITCQRFGDLPESLRRYTDVVLRLPQLDPETFEILFERVIGKVPPAAWRASGTEWVKHVLHTDFEHPRRMQLPPTKAFAYIRGQVEDRLRTVDPGTGLGLSDLHGLGEAREWAEDLIADIHAAIDGKLPWSQVDRGALLVGAPGTGKTTLAKAIAKACGVKFVQGSASAWMAEGVSLGPHISAIRRTFAEARDYAPSILFIDEIDSIGSREKLKDDRNALYQTEVINAVLEQIQGLDPAAPMFVIGATNNEEGVDPALRRAGRLDRVIQIPRPNSAALDFIYRYYVAALGPAIAVDAALDTLALGKLSVGLTGADVERIVRGASRRARKLGRPMSQTDVMDEVTNKPRGSDTTLTLTPADIERTATHEAGHALALFLSASKGADIGFVTIVPRDNGTLGFVQPLPDERVHLTRQDYEDQLDVFVAGRAAEELRYGKNNVSSGASSDLQGATILVTRMVTQLGLPGSGKLLLSNEMSTADMAQAETALDQAYQRALKKLKSHRKQLDRLAKALTDHQELTGDEARVILEDRVP